MTFKESLGVIFFIALFVGAVVLIVKHEQYYREDLEKRAEERFKPTRDFMQRCWKAGGEPIVNGPVNVCAAKQPMGY